MSAANKLVYTLQAVYEGKGEIKQLNDDLKQLKQVEIFQGLQETFSQTNKDFVDAKKKLRELRKEMQKPGGDAYAESYKKARQHVEKLSSSLNKQKAKLNATRTDLKRAGVDVTNLAGNYTKLKTSSEKTAKVLAAQAKLGVKPMADIEREVKGLEKAYKDLQRSGKYSLNDMARAKDQLNSKVRKLRGETKGWKDNLDQVQQGWLGIAGVVATVAAAAKSISFFANFDDSMRTVKAVSGSSVAEFAKLTEAAKQLGATTRFTATQAAQGMEELAQSGMDYKEIIQTLPQAMNLASISGGSIKEGADLITDTLKQFRLDVVETGRVADVLTEGYTGASTSLQALGQALSYAGPVTASFGYSLEDTVAILQALAEAGFKGSRGGTALVGGMTRLVNPTGKAIEVLDKYAIKVFDAEGKVRNFADILDEVANASLTPTEQMQLFGQEAGPGMAGLLAQGGDAIRKFTKNLQSSGGVAESIAGDIEDGIGGALRSLGSSLQAVVLAFAESWAPAIEAAAEALTAFARVIAGMPEGLKILTSGLAVAGAATMSWHLGLGLIFGGMKAGVTTMATFASGLNGVNLATMGLAGTLGTVAAAAGALFVGYNIGKWIDEWQYFNDVVGANKTALEEVPEKFRKITEATGVTIRSFDDLNAAQKKGLIEFDEVTGEWVKGAGERTAAVAESAAAQQQVSGEALDEMKRQYGEYVDEIKRLQDEISGRERSLYEQLSNIRRTGMSDFDSWKDIKKQADEYRKTAEAAAKAGDFDTAKEAADKAREYYAKLNTEVKENDKVMVSADKARKTAFEGVKKSGELAVDILKKQQAAASDAMAELTEKSGFQDLSDNMESSKKQWLDNWQKMEGASIKNLNAVDKKLDQVMRDRTAKLSYTVSEKRSGGGKIGSVLAMAGGGSVRNALGGFHFPGYGGGDRDKNLVMAEDGEVMIRKEMVRASGLRAALAWNAGRFDIVLRELMQRFDMGILKKRMGGAISLNVPSLPALPQMMSGGGVVAGASAAAGPGGGDVFNITVNAGGGVDGRSLARQVMDEIERARRRRS